ncbi:glycoside hydrolase family 65 protein [Streptomyces iconiensis]|uniref:Glycosyl hydrolase family 65 protein n=1 Tax=Streptomyces iconiensis TaxID=1384038 RepID=A0ABT7A938_9ACTN|nr:glycosyl hydrolase family 65 protein [Streptomyces iconiensis]MDJ1137128.1 glycosyl hydrolase family 65 protein [Streptomyces iconiensis]
MTDWLWEYEGYDPGEERLREALCTLGNGYFATRGAAPECEAGPHHYPGTYAAGCYNRLVSEVAGRQVENEDLVNLPNWLPLRFRFPSDDGSFPSEDGSRAATWWSPDEAPGPLEHRLSLDLAHGTLTRRLRARAPDGRTLAVEQVRLLHMGDPHLAALRTTFTAEGWSGGLEVESALDGTVRNTGVERYSALAGRHLCDVETGEAAGMGEAWNPGEMPKPDEVGGAGQGTVWLRCRTTTSRLGIGMAARTLVSPPQAPGTTALSGARAAQRVTLALRDGEPVTVDKTAALFTSRDPAISEPATAACELVRGADGFEGLLASHHRAWRHLWERAELDVPGEAGHILRLHLFHVLQTLSPHTAVLDAGVPARGLHGEAYRGHVFWDELFVLPYLNLHLPEVSRALLTYRHRRLPAACRAAGELGLRGAMYPWQSGSDGREETQTLHLNPRSQRWLPDASHLQRHAGSAVAYNVWRYAQATGDREFLHAEGADMLLRIARFWSLAAEYDPDEARYRIRGVMGPDEYHEAYPGAEKPGLDDNAYTNLTAAWVLARALELAAALPEPRRTQLFEEMALDAVELERWEDVSRRLRVPFHRGVISQFEGYGELAELDWEGYRARYGDIRRLDRILEAEGDSVNRYQASKQADALMLGYLFPSAELAALFRRLGYRLDDELWRRTVDHYLPRTSHGSTLSGLVHGWLLARERRPEAWAYVQEALLGDVADIQGGTTPEGIHLGAMAGTLDLVQRGLPGLEIHDAALCLDPSPLPELYAYGFSVRFRGHWGVGIRVRSETLEVSVPPTAAGPLTVGLPDRTEHVAPGESRSLGLPAGPPAIRPEGHVPGLS